MFLKGLTIATHSLIQNKTKRARASRAGGKSVHLNQYHQGLVTVQTNKE